MKTGTKKKSPGKTIWYLLCILAVTAGSLWYTVREARAAEPRGKTFQIEISKDGKMWTVVQALPEGEKENETPVFWYEKGTECRTGKSCAIEEPKAGEHVYRYDRTGEIPVGKWKVEDEHAYCTSRRTEQDKEGIFSGSPDSCGLPYFSGWMAYCADCGEEILQGNIHMSREAAESLDMVDADKGYYFLCPCLKPVYAQGESGKNFVTDYELCGHLDKYWEAEPHKCKGVSYNRYRVVYHANGENVKGIMAPSFHMYENGTFYEGKSVTPARTLALCTYDRTEEGYVFAGWNTEPDGTGISYEDGAEIRNLTTENYEESTGLGSVDLYAQWEKAQSLLIIDVGEGSYRGEKSVMGTWGSYWYWKEENIIPPKGSAVFFQPEGGTMGVFEIRGTCSFQRWKLAAPAGGELLSHAYRFTGANHTVDIIRAVYVQNPVLLPSPEKEGCFFGGWYFDKACTQLAGYGGESKLFLKDVTLYAKWTDLKLTAVPDNSEKGETGRIKLTWEQRNNTGKVYRLYQKEEGQPGFEQIFFEQNEAEAVINQYYEYENETGCVVIPSSGFYYLEAEGAQGENYGSSKGGLGGSTRGRFYFEKEERVDFTVGGQNGYNGGGVGTSYGNGGGYTVAVSDKKGILLIAGGGGGAGEFQDGMSGGNESGGREEESRSGEEGTAGGGGGYQGGKAGTNIVHIHSEEEGCYKDVSFNALAPEYGIVPVTKEWRDTSDEGDTAIKDDVYFSAQAGSPAKLIPVNGNKVLDLGVWMQGTGINLLSETSYIQVMNQNGVPFFTVTVAEIRQEWENFEKKVVQSVGNGLYKGWPPVANVTMKTFWRQSNPNGGEYDYTLGYYVQYPVFYENGSARFASAEFDENYQNPVFYGDYAGEYYPSYSLWYSDILSHRGFNDRPLLFEERSEWYGMSGVHFKYEIQIPEGTTGIYLYGEGKMNAVANHEGEQTSHPVMKCEINFDKIYLTGGRILSCNAQDIELPAYGGSNYINVKYALSSVSAAGEKEGNGSLRIKTDMAGFTEDDSWDYANAPDKAAPCAIKAETVRMNVVGDNCIMVDFDEAGDCGTRYFFWAEAYSVSTGEKLCDSNIAECLVKSGVKGYYYRVDGERETTLAVLGRQNPDGLQFSEKGKIRTEIGDALQYLHIAAVDYAGNIGDTIHIDLDAERIEAAWKVSTGRVAVSGIVGGQDYGNIYLASAENTYYIRADGKSPFLVSFQSYMHGPARADYQVNHQIFAFRAGAESQRYGAVLPYSEKELFGKELDPAEFRQWSEGFSIVEDASHTGAVRSNGARNVEYYRAFVLRPDQHGKTVAVWPVAGAVNKTIAEYSDIDEEACGIRLVGDGTGPEIMGLDKLAEWRLIDRRTESVTLELFAEDDLSGVDSFYLEVWNMDNFQKERYLPDEDGVIRVSITEAEPVFSGDFAVYAYAADRVGNETTVSRTITEFELKAEVWRILAPHEPVLKQGESAILRMEIWGYAEKAEVLFPDFLAEYNKTFFYSASPQYKKEEEIQFMIPLKAPEDEYEIIVRAYKGDRQLEVHPVISTVEVNGSVLDELRTRLR